MDTLTVCSGVVWEAVDDVVVILDLDTSTYLRLNGTGSRLWPLLCDGVTEDALVGSLVEGYDLDPRDATRDLHQFLDDLRAVRLIT